LVCYLYLLGEGIWSPVFFGAGFSRKRAFILEVVLATVIGMIIFSFPLLFLALLYTFNEIAIYATMLSIFAIKQFFSYKFKRQIPRNLEKCYFGVEYGTIASALYGLFIAVFLRSHSTWPGMPGWDVYSHMYLVQYVMHFNGIYSLFIPYPTTFHILLAGISKLVGISAFDLFWFGIYVTLPLFSITAYYFLLGTTKQPFASAIGSIIVTSFCGFAQTLGPNYLFPSTLSVILFHIILGLAINNDRWGKAELFILVLLLTVLSLVYFYATVLVFPLVYNVIYCAKVQKRKRFKISPWLILLFFLLLMLVASLITPDPFGLDIFWRLDHLCKAYGSITFFIFTVILGVALLTNYDKNLRVNFIPINSFYRFMYVYIFLLMISYFIPYGPTYRLELYLRIFVAMMVSFAIVPLSYIRREKAICIFGLVTVLFLIINPIELPYSKDIARYEWLGTYSNISSDEYDAMIWLKHNAKITDGVLTDPATARICEAIAFRYSSDKNRIDPQLLMDFFLVYSERKLCIHEVEKTGDRIILQNDGVVETIPRWTIISTTVLDQVNTYQTGSYSIYGNRKIAQTFSPSERFITEISLKLKVDENLNDTVLISLTQLKDGYPCHEVLAQASIPTTELNGTLVEYSFNVSHQVEPGQKYAIVVELREGKGDADTRLYIAGSVEDKYPRGTMFYFNGQIWKNMSESDLVFKTFAPPQTIVNPTLTLGSRSLSYRGVVEPGMELVIKSDGYAYYGNENVTESIVGEILTLEVGENIIEYSDSNAGKRCVRIKVEWDEIKGAARSENELLRMLNDQLVAKTKGIVHSIKFVVISARTSQWVKMNDPHKLNYVFGDKILPFDGMNKFNSTRYQLVYQNRSVKIYRYVGSS